MIVELRKKSQITLPKEIIKQLRLNEGDNFEVIVENGCILLQPVAVYSKEYISKLASEIKVLREDPKYNNESFKNVDDLINNLKNDKTGI